MASDSGEDFFRGAWGWFAVIVVLVVFNTVLGEELLFEVFCCRECGASLEGDFVANGALFAVYHLHTPWVIPSTLVDIFALAYPSRRFQSAWMGIIVPRLRASSSSGWSSPSCSTRPRCRSDSRAILSPGAREC